MLVQVVALLSLGVLCSSAPLQEEQRVGLIIREILHDMQKLNLNEVPSLVTVDTTVERCMQTHLRTFARTLADLDDSSKSIALKLGKINTYESILPKDLDKECKTVQVTSDAFLETLDLLLRLLFEKIQNA